MLSHYEALITLVVFCAVMIAIGIYSRKKRETIDDFVLMDRNLGGLSGAISIAVSWIWAPAVFICSLKAFTQGLPGVFWFTAPNILCFFVFAFVMMKLRHKFENGYSLPDYLTQKFPNTPYVHISSLVVFFGYQLGAIIINCLAGGTLLALLTGIDIAIAIISLSSVALIYSFIGGLRASVATDKLQMALIIFIALILVPLVTAEAGGVQTILDGLGGKSGLYTNLFDPGIAYSFGIAVTISLISGPLADQMFYQRAFAVPKDKMLNVFIGGGLLFGVVPIVLSLLGLIGAAPYVLSEINVTDPQMIGPIVIDHFLPSWALIGFVILAFAGLCSTLDSAYAAISCLGSIDVHKKYLSDKLSHLQFARISMVVFYILGTGLALLEPQLLWVFLIYGALASGIFIPVIFSIFSENVSGRAVFASIVLSIIAVLPLSIYANAKENTDLIVLSSIIAPLIGILVCGGSHLLKAKA